MPTNAEIVAAVREAFATTRPARFTTFSPQAAEYGDDEGHRAEALFASRTPDTLRSRDVGIGAGWPETFLTQSALDYYMPGFVRLILEADGDAGFELDDFLSILAPDRIADMNQQQRSAIADALEFIRNQHHAESAEVIDRRLKRLRA